MFEEQILAIYNTPPTPFTDEDGIKSSDDLLAYISSVKYNNNWDALLTAARDNSVSTVGQEMDVKAAMLACEQYIDGSDLPEVNPEFGKDHLHYMVNELRSWDVADQKTLLKAHRWLGYIQGVLVAGGAATLAEMKLINMNS